MAKQLTDDLVMPILVDPSRFSDAGGHTEIIREVALRTFDAVFVMRAQARYGKPLTFWLESGMRKTVRKVKADALCKAKEQEFLDPTLSSSSLVSTYDTRIEALARYEDFVPLAKRAQVSGWNLNPGPEQLLEDQRAADAVICVDADLSTGKAAAAAAHVATLLALELQPRTARLMVTALHQHLHIRFAQDLASDKRLALKIHDSGHTEVEPGHVTAGYLG